jgi:hypothetical protein
MVGHWLPPVVGVPFGHTKSIPESPQVIPRGYSKLRLPGMTAGISVFDVPVLTWRPTGRSQASTPWKIKSSAQG